MIALHIFNGVKVATEGFSIILVYKPQGEKTLIGSKIYDDNCTMI